MFARRCTCSESAAGALLQVESSNLFIDTSMVQLRPIERPPSREVWNTNMAILASPCSHRYLASEPAPIVGDAMSARGERCPEGGADSSTPIRAAPRQLPITRASGRGLHVAQHGDREQNRRPRRTTPTLTLPRLRGREGRGPARLVGATTFWCARRRTGRSRHA